MKLQPQRRNRIPRFSYQMASQRQGRPTRPRATGFTTAARRLRAAACAAGLVASVAAFSAIPIALPTGAAQAAGQQMGQVTGLPVPRFVSLKSDRVNLREGPSKEHRTTWIFQRAGLPVEITAEFDVWRRIRDSEGAEGWVLHSLLSGRRTALVAPWKKGEDIALRGKPAAEAALSARLQNGVIGQLKKCDGAWCRLIGEGFDGWIEQGQLWGAYPGEKID